MIKTIYSFGRRLLGLLNVLLDKAFDADNNPLRHLGSLTIFFCWIVLVSGLWLFIFFKTTVAGAYQSVEYLTQDQWYLGGVMRSLHRYASDAAIVTLMLHIFSEFSFDRYRGPRWFSWVTGLPLLWLLIPLGITGYWLVWDQLAQYVALTTGELIDWLPIFTDSMARNFLSDDAVSDRFFTLMAFLHLIGLPVFLVFGIWLHVFRLNGPRINPPRLLMAGSLLSMLVLSLVYPALSQGQADLAIVPSALNMDWYYLLIYPLVQSWSPGWVWLLLMAVSLLIGIAPWLPPARKPAVAVVNLNNCNGCERCVDDCPFAAVSMAPRSDGAAYASEAVVDTDLCVSCGICVGACPTATPFRARSALVPGIDLKKYSASRMRDDLHETAHSLTGEQRVLAIGCKGSAAVKELKAANKSVLELRCMAHLPPPYIDYALSRNLADGVMLLGCAGGDCHYRYGTEWTEQRLLRKRDPILRKRVDSHRIAMRWQQPWSAEPDILDTLHAFQQQLAGMANNDTQAAVTSPPPKIRRAAALGLSFGLFALLTGIFSVWPIFRQIEADMAMLSVSFSHAGQRLQECRNLSPEELGKLAPNMRQAQDCPRERRPIEVLFEVDGVPRYQDILNPSGIWKDGEAVVYQRLPVAAGPRTLSISMRDGEPGADYDYMGRADVNLQPHQHLVIEFDSEQKAFIFR